MTIPNRGPQLQAAAIGLLVLAVLSFAQRAYVRTFMVKAFGMDDWLMSGAMISYIFFATCVLAGIHYGTGRHMADLSDHDQQMALEVSFGEQTQPYWVITAWSCLRISLADSRLTSSGSTAMSATVGP